MTTARKQFGCLNRLPFVGSTPGSGVGSGGPPLPSFAEADRLTRERTKQTRPGRKHELARERRETDTARAEGMVQEGLDGLGWTEQSLAQQPKGHPEKVHLARALRRRTPMTRHWIARRLGMGSASYLSHLLGPAGVNARDTANVKIR